MNPAIVALAATADWGAALDAYRSKRAYSDALPMMAPDVDEAVDAYCAAMDVLILTPAPDHDALAYKMELARVRCDGFTFDDDYMDALIADVRRLGGAA